jgi:hypothetical protein
MAGEGAPRQAVAGKRPVLDRDQSRQIGGKP